MMILDSAVKVHVVITNRLMPELYGMDSETLARLPNVEIIEFVGFSRTMLLQNVHYIPHFKFNLMSITSI